MLYGTQNCVQGNNCHDNDGALPIAGNCRNDCCNDQDNNQKVFKLLQEYNNRTFFLFFCQGVFSIGLTLFFNLCPCQTVLGYAKLFQHLLGCTAKHLFHFLIPPSIKTTFGRLKTSSANLSAQKKTFQAGSNTSMYGNHMKSLVTNQIVWHISQKILKSKINEIVANMSRTTPF